MPVISDISIVIRAITKPFTSSLNKAAGVVKGIFGTIASVVTPLLAVFKSIGSAIFKLVDRVGTSESGFSLAVSHGSVSCLERSQAEYSRPTLQAGCKSWAGHSG